jgi:hypothetical protein
MKAEIVSSINMTEEQITAPMRRMNVILEALARARADERLWLRDDRHGADFMPMSSIDLSTAVPNLSWSEWGGLFAADLITTLSMYGSDRLRSISCEYGVEIFVRHTVES